MKFLLVGLGNIGLEYKYTRHNIGFLILDRMASKYEATWKSDRLADITEFRVKNKKVTAIKPTTYMNNSGKAYKYWLQSLNIDITDSLVIVDDLSLDFGILRIKPKGSDGGHNGLADIQKELNTEKYPRLRFGIGNNFSTGHQVDYVLGKWTDDEVAKLPEAMNRAIDAIEATMLSGINNAMNIYNTKPE